MINAIELFVFRENGFVFVVNVMNIILQNFIFMKVELYGILSLD